MTRFNVIAAFNEFLLNLYIALGRYERCDFLDGCRKGQAYLSESKVLSHA